MFKQQTRYSLIAIIGVVLIGCSSPKTITITPNTQPIIAGGARTITHQAPIIQGAVIQPSYPERIETRVEVPENVRTRVEPTIVQTRVPQEVPKIIVPRNNPTIGVKRGVERLSSGSTIKDVDRLNGEKMERISFPLDEYRSLKKRGRSTVSGKVFITNSMTDKEIVGKSLKLYLNPVTSYSTQWYNESYLSGYKMSKVDKRLYNYLKFSTSNNNGKFDFFGVAKGKYYL
ncbi:MAG: hypothetical protein KAG56_06725, partial [Sulfurovaceae bacterium]|nr:hypothetical protein [Sulfurovaceae bacterium]